MKTIELKIKGMNCKSCEILITDSLEGLDGIASVNVSQKEGYAKISFNEEKVSLNQIKDAIKEAGFSVIV